MIAEQLVPREKTSPQSFASWQSRILFTLWITYGSLYLCRINLSSAQPHMESDLRLTKEQLGSIGGALLIGYAVGQFVNGTLADRLGARLLIGIGAFGSVALNVLFGFSESPATMRIIWGLNGYLQACWPGFSKTLANWFPPESRGHASGIMGCSYQVGSAVTLILAGAVSEQFGWRAVFWTSAALVAAATLFFLARSRNSPESVGLPPIEGSSGVVIEEDRAVTGLPETPTPPRVQLKEALHNPAVWVVALSFFCLDITRFGFIQWGVHYLKETGGTRVDVAAIKVAILPLAGCAGSLFAGWATGRLFAGRRIPICMLMLIGLAAATFVFMYLDPQAVIAPMLGLAVVGFMIYGPQVLMTSAIPMDFASRRAAGTATGFIDGFGYIGASIQAIVVGKLLNANYGWNSVFIFLSACALVGAVLLLPLWNYRPPKRAYL